VTPIQDGGREALRAALDTVFAGPAYQWREPRRPFAFLGRWWTWFREWFDALRESHPLAADALVWGLVGLLLLILLHAGWLAYRIVRSGAGRHRAPDLPAPPPRRDAAWYRAESERLAQAGALVEAMQADLVALLLELDGRRVLRYHPGKTPQEHVAEATLAEESRAELRRLVWGFYRHAFGRDPVTAEHAAAWRARTVVERYASAR